MDVVARFEVYLVSLNPTQGSEIRKTRPCVVASPDELNTGLRTVIIAPMTTTLRSLPFRVPVTFQGKKGEIACDQLRAVDKARLIKKLGKLTDKTTIQLSNTLVEMFEK